MFLHENHSRDVATRCGGWDGGVRLDRATAGAVAGIAEAADGLACRAEGRQGDVDVDDSGTYHGPAEDALSGKD